MVKLQRPAYAYMGGKVVAWDDAHVHVSSESLIRGISVFEGIKGYWSHDNTTFNILQLEAHFARLQRSARLSYLPFDWSYARFVGAIEALVSKLVSRERDMWVRTTLASIDGHWGEATTSDLILTAYHQDKQRPAPIDLGISTWRRGADVATPTRIKAASNYHISRLARIEGRRQGYGDMVLLNSMDRVAEASASCILLVRNGCVITPPATEGCLESITVDLIEAICAHLNIDFERRPIDRTELTIADELALAGTLAELMPVKSVEGLPLPAQRPVLDRVADFFWGAVRGAKALPVIQLTPLNVKQTEAAAA